MRREHHQRGTLYDELPHHSITTTHPAELSMPFGNGSPVSAAVRVLPIRAV